MKFNKKKYIKYTVKSNPEHPPSKNNLILEFSFVFIFKILFFMSSIIDFFIAIVEVLLHNFNLKFLIFS